MSANKLKFHITQIPYLYLLSLAFLTSANLLILGNRLMVPELVFLVVALIFLYSKVGGFAKFMAIDWLLVAYLVSNLISSLLSHEMPSLAESIGKVYLFLVYLMFKELTLSTNFRDNFKFYVKILVAILISTGLGGWVLAELGITSRYVYHFKDYPYFGSINRLQGITPNPTMYISLLSCFLVILWSFHKNVFLNLLGITSILLTFSKSIFLFIAGYIFYGRSSRKTIQKIYVVTGCIFYLTANYYISTYKTSPNQEVINSAPALKNKYFAVHPTIYLERKSTLFASFLDHPLIGIGPGNTNKELARFQQLGYYPKTFDTNCDPLSTYFGIMAETGIVGMLICILIAAQLFTFLKRAFIYGDLLNKAIATCFLIGSIEAINSDMLNFRHYWVLLGVLVGLDIQKQQQTGDKAKLTENLPVWNEGEENGVQR